MALPKHVRKWLRFALDDLKVARAIEDMGSAYWRGCAYHSQQAAEKAIKGYLTFRQIRFTKTHDIATLLQTIKTIDPKLAQSLNSAKRLTKFAVEYRYPEASNRSMTKQKAMSARKLAEITFQTIIEKMR